MSNNFDNLMEDTNRLIAETQQEIAQIEQNNATSNVSDVTSLDPVSSTLDMCNNLLREAQNITEGKYSPEELEALSNKHSAMANTLVGYNAVEDIHASVSESHQHFLDSDMAHHSRMMADEYELSGNSHLDKAAEEMRTGGSSFDEFEAAQDDFNRAQDYYEWAEIYAPE